MGRSRSCSPEKCPIINKSKSHQEHLALRSDIQQPCSPPQQRCRTQNIEQNGGLDGNSPSNTDLDGGTGSQTNVAKVQFQKRTSDDQISTELSTIDPVADRTGMATGGKSPELTVGAKIGTTASGLVYYLQTVREPIVDYQESRGISRNEEITFVTLITSLCTQAYTAAITILVMLWNLMPLVDGFVYFFRFILDKLIDIIQTSDPKERAIKGLIFTGELIVTMFLIFLILGLIFMPVYVLLAQLTTKIFSMVAW